MCSSIWCIVYVTQGTWRNGQWAATIISQSADYNSLGRSALINYPSADTPTHKQYCSRHKKKLAKFSFFRRIFFSFLLHSRTDLRKWKTNIIWFIGKHLCKHIKYTTNSTRCLQNVLSLCDYLWVSINPLLSNNETMYSWGQKNGLVALTKSYLQIVVIIILAFKNGHRVWVPFHVEYQASMEFISPGAPGPLLRTNFLLVNPH